MINKYMKKLTSFRSLIAVLIIITLSVFPLPNNAVNAAPADDSEDIVTTQGSTAAPPSYFNLYIQSGDADSLFLGSFTSTQLHAWARLSNTGEEILKYSSTSYSGYGGRVVKEYIPLTDFLTYASREVQIPVDYDSGDYLIMGEDFTKDQSLIDAGYSYEDLTGNWYSYDAMLGTDRYYYPYWNSGNSQGAVKVPTVIGIKSYGGSSGVSDAVLDMYAASCDYLWAYVLYFGQEQCTDLTYPYFYYDQYEATIRYDDDGVMNQTIRALLEAEIATAEVYADETLIATSAASVAQGKYWVTQSEYNAFIRQYGSAQDAVSASDTTNGTAYETLLNITEANELFASQRKAGQKSGYFWYTEHEDGTPYVITSADQLWELSLLVNGNAYDENTSEYFDACDFRGDTILLANDIDTDGNRPCIGTASHPFNGIFEGQGYTISGLSITGLTVANVGLFGYIGSAGNINELNVSGLVKTSDSVTSVGGIAGYNAGSIMNCRSYMSIESDNVSTGFAGSVAGRNSGSIINCLGAGTVKGSTSSGSIVGRNDGTVKGCLGIAELTEYSLRCGLAGQNTSVVFNCIAVSSRLWGSNTGTFTCSYTFENTAGPEGGIVSDIFADTSDTDLTSDTVFDYLSSQYEPASLTGSEFVQTNGGYPALKWQQTYTVYFDSLFDDLIIGEEEAGEYLPITEPAAPEQSGYVFAGWYTGSEFTEQYDFNTAVTGDFILYAGWCSEGADSDQFHSLGDVDMNGVVDSRDAALLKRYLAGRQSLTSYQCALADVNSSAAPDNDDPELIIKKSIGMIK